ncbi:MAG: glycosyltransferase family 4 protein [Opitutales bacterium]
MSFPFLKKRKTKITKKKLQDFYLPNIKSPRSPFEFDEKNSPRKMANSSRKKGEAMRIDWLIPDFGIGSGGHTTIFRTILWLEKFGHQNKIWICGGTHHGDAKKALSIIHRHFFSLEADLDILLDPLDFIADSDAIVCTSYDTCYFGRAINFDGEKFYFVQDFEPEFSPIGSYYYLAEDTYRFGLNCITAGYWLAEKVKSVGGKVVGSFELAIDKSIFFRSQSERSKDSFQIAVYARCGTPRRLTELSIFALNLLSKKGLQFQVHFFGDSSLPFYADFPHQIHGVLSPHQLGSLYRRCTVGCVFSATNYSLVPLEMMACGLPVIEFDGANTRRTFPDNTVSFAKPSPESIADEIEKILCNENQRNIQIECAIKYVSELSWEKSAKKVETAFLNTIDMKIPDLKIN